MTSRRPIYLDHHATTPLDERVLEAMSPYLREEFGNAASRTHVFGWRAEAAVEDARERLCEMLGAADPAEIVFTSGATESNNLAILGLAEAEPSRRHLITVQTEHPSVLDPCRALSRRGFETLELPVDSRGFVDVDAIEAAIRDDTFLVSVMAANNEIGVLQPIREIASLCRDRGIFFHSDAAQAAGKIEIDVGRDIVTVDGVDVTMAIRSEAVNATVSQVAANGGVRAAMLRQQRGWARRRGGGVLEGRDIGSVVFPSARLKVYVTASLEERARRRAAQSGEPYEEIVAALETRDAKDSNRADSPLTEAAGAVVLDSTGMSIDDVVDQVVEMFGA